MIFITQTNMDFGLVVLAWANYLTTLNLSLTILESGKNGDVIYLDFAKAFDKVDFDIVLNKIKSLGISGKLFKWLKNFLIGRTQLVEVDGKKSVLVDFLSGVPQGIDLGPLIFLIL